MRGMEWKTALLCLRPHRAEALSDDFVWRLSVAYIGPKSRTERPRKTKIGTEVARVTLDSDTTFKIKRSKDQLVADVLNSRNRCHWANKNKDIVNLQGAKAYCVATRTACSRCHWPSAQTYP